jgi:hypothetical protein
MKGQPKYTSQHLSLFCKNARLRENIKNLEMHGNTSWETLV